VKCVTFFVQIILYVAIGLILHCIESSNLTWGFVFFVYGSTCTAINYIIDEPRK
jgi:hypothetical protein